MVHEGGHSLEKAVRQHLKRYFDLLRKHGATSPCPLYDLVLAEVEKPLLEETLRFCRQNQSKAAGLLGMNRNTLSRKMRAHGISPSGNHPGDPE